MAMKKTGHATSTTQGLIWGLAVSILITLTVALALAKMIDKEVLAWENTGYIILFMMVLASFFGAFTSCQKIKRQRLAISIISGLLYWITLISCTAMFYGGEYESIAITGVSIAIGSLIGFLMTSLMPNRSKSRKYKLHTR